MTETTARAGVLSGIKVIDFGHFVAGPLTAVMLADQGAEVVHVDRPGAELAESDAFLNRGKRRVTLDLKDPADAAIAARLAASADVVIENFRPGVMDRHGLGWQQLAPVAPRLIYCSLPGFGRDDPRAAILAWEGVVAAATANRNRTAATGAARMSAPMASTSGWTRSAAAPSSSAGYWTPRARSPGRRTA